MSRWHLGNAQRGLHQREPGVLVTDAVADAGVSKVAPTVSTHPSGADDAPVLAYAAPSLLIASFALLPAIAAAIVRHCHRSIGLAALCALPALWCIGEWLRQFG